MCSLPAARARWYFGSSPRLYRTWPAGIGNPCSPSGYAKDASHDLGPAHPSKQVGRTYKPLSAGSLHPPRGWPAFPPNQIPHGIPQAPQFPFREDKTVLSPLSLGTTTRVNIGVPGGGGTSFAQRFWRMVNKAFHAIPFVAPDERSADPGSIGLSTSASSSS